MKRQSALFPHPWFEVLFAIFTDRTDGQQGGEAVNGVSLSAKNDIAQQVKRAEELS